MKKSVLEAASYLDDIRSTFYDVVGMEEAKSTLTEAICLPMFLQHVTGHPLQHVLVYGPHGVGKTHLVRALQGELNSLLPENEKCHAFRLYPSDIMCRRFQALGLCTALFKDIREKYTHPLVIIDDAEGLFHEETGSPISPTLKLELMDLLQEISALGHDSEVPVPVIMVTSKPWQIHHSFCTQFTSKVYVGMPDYACRVDLVRKGIQRMSNSLSTLDVETIARQTVNFPSSGVMSLICQAQMNIVKELQQVTHFKQVVQYDQVEGHEKLMYVASTPDDPDAKAMSILDMHGELSFRPLTQKDVLQSLSRYRIIASGEWNDHVKDTHLGWEFNLPEDKPLDATDISHEVRPLLQCSAICIADAIFRNQLYQRGRGFCKLVQQLPVPLVMCIEILKMAIGRAALVSSHLKLQ